MERYPKVFIVVLNYNGKDIIKENISSVMDLDYPDFELVVVDNNSQDGSLEIIRQMWPKIHIIKNSQNIGYAAGNNIGIKFSLERGAQYVLLLNNDTVCQRDFVSRLVEAAQNNKRIGILSPVIFEGKTQKVWFSGGEISWMRMKTKHQRENIKKEKAGYKSTGFITGCAMMVRNEVFSRIGLLDEDFFLYWEDADFSVRAKKAGFEIVIIPSSRIYHMEKSNHNDKKIYWLVISGLIFFKKNTPALLIPWIVLYTVARRIKNWQDIRKKKNLTTALMVKKAYDDFKRAGT